MVFEIIYSSGEKMAPVFFKQALGWLLFLKAHVIPYIIDTFPDPQEILFIQDDAPCDTAKTVQIWLSDIMNFWAKYIWPLSSPELNPINFSVWAYIEARDYIRQHHKISTFKAPSPSSGVKCRSQMSKVCAQSSGLGLKL